MLIRFFDRAVAEVERGLEFSTRRHEVLSQNIANIETPGYRARDLTFDAELRPALGVSQAVSLTTPSGTADPLPREPRIVFAGDGSAKPNGNDVNLDREMAKLAENTLFHNALVQMLAGQFTALKQSISGRV